MSSDAVHKAIDPAISELKSIPGIFSLFLIEPVLPLGLKKGLFLATQTFESRKPILNCKVMPALLH
jgi:hypothetical protein